MRMRGAVWAVASASLLFGLLRAPLPPMAAQAQVTSLGDPEKLKATVLERMGRLPPTYRGENPMRLKWEWYDGMCQNYIFEKEALVEALSTERESDLRMRYVFRNVKVTYQEIFQLTDKDDDKLIPVLSSPDFLAHARGDVFQGLTLFGKGGEAKGTITRQYLASTIDARDIPGPPILQSYFRFVRVVEYKAREGGALEIARGAFYDSVNLRWRDIKNLVADDMSEDQAAEARELRRTAYKKSLKDYVPKT